MLEKLRKFVAGVLAAVVSHLTAVWVLITVKTAAYYVGYVVAIAGIDLGFPWWI